MIKKVIVKNIDNYSYTLVDDDNKKYVVNIEFYSKYKPTINDMMYINDEILNKKCLYSFDDVYDTKIKNINDYIKVIHNKNEYYLQRAYG